MTIKPQTRIALIYIAVSLGWVWASDQLLLQLVHDPRLLNLWAASKRLAFVACSAYLIYWLVDRDLRRVEAVSRERVEGHVQALGVLVSALDIRHKETRDHSERVSRMAVGLGRLAGVRGEALRNLRLGALLHDIGKLGLPDEVLIKPGPLDASEMAVMRTHTSIGRDLLKRIDFLRDVTDIPYAHHERWDGGGYPSGLAGEAIPLAARVFSVVDVWDALSHVRVYKPAWPQDEVLSYLRGVAGSQLDPYLVELFLDHYNELVLLADGTDESDEEEQPTFMPTAWLAT